MSASYPKIVFLDLEGTLFLKHYALDNGKVAPSAWTVLADYLGPECLKEEEATKDRWLANGYPGYVEWMRDTIRIHQKYGLTRDVFEEVINSVPLVPGADECVAEFRSRGAITAIISGGFKALGDRAQRRLRIDHVFCACEYFFGSDGLIEHFNLLPSDDTGKVPFMQLIAREHGVNPADCAFVGDGKNDVPMARAVGKAIAFNAQPELCAVCDHQIVQARGAEDFGEVARLLAQ